MINMDLATHYSCKTLAIKKRNDLQKLLILYEIEGPFCISFHFQKIREISID